MPRRGTQLTTDVLDKEIRIIVKRYVIIQINILIGILMRILEMDVRDIISKYRQVGYINEMRKQIGHDLIITTACGVIIENEKREILLQRRQDNGLWGLPGGSMEPGEKFEEAAKREVLEEVGIQIDELSLFGIYSGEDRVITYPNGDICCVTSIVFRAGSYVGQIQNNTLEAIEHRFFDKRNIPDDINSFDKLYITDWANNPDHVIVN